MGMNNTLCRNARNIWYAPHSPPITTATSVTLAQIQTPGPRRTTRLTRKSKPPERSAEKAITKPEMTKKICTPTQPKWVAKKNSGKEIRCCRLVDETGKGSVQRSEEHTSE